MNTDNGVVPGVSRSVMDDRTGGKVFRIVYCEDGFLPDAGRGDEPAGGVPGQCLSVREPGTAGAGADGAEPGMALGAGRGAVLPDDGV